MHITYILLSIFYTFIEDNNTYMYNKCNVFDKKNPKQYNYDTFAPHLNDLILVGQQ